MQHAWASQQPMNSATNSALLTTGMSITPHNQSVSSLPVLDSGMLLAYIFHI